MSNWFITRVWIWGGNRSVWRKDEIVRKYPSLTKVLKAYSYTSWKTWNNCKKYFYIHGVVKYHSVDYWIHYWRACSSFQTEFSSQICCFSDRIHLVCQSFFFFFLIFSNWKHFDFLGEEADPWSWISLWYWCRPQHYFKQEDQKCSISTI